jgi:23S rRNA (adenine2503-C2)-methyltransferase
VVTTLTELGPPELEAALAADGLEPFRARQLLGWIYRHGATDFGRMTDLSRDLRDELSRRYRILGSRLSARAPAADGTEKFLVRLADGNLIETVLIPDGRRLTACISTQVGCPVGCVFCASGLDGLRRNLSAGEIVEQLLHLPRRPTHVVVMGIGEPLLNFGPLTAALRVMHERWGMGIGYNKITLSTAGIVDKIARLIEEKVTPNLAISLHAPDDALRARLVPGIRRWTIDDLVEAGRRYRRATGKDVTFEYVLLAGINDGPEQAAALAGRLRTARVKLNVIPYNGVPGLPYRRPAADAIDRFVRTVGAGGVPVTVRRQRGDDASAACGQLRAAFASS